MLATYEDLQWRSCSFKCRIFCPGKMRFYSSYERWWIWNTSFKKKNVSFIFFSLSGNKTSLFGACWLRGALIDKQLENESWNKSSAALRMDQLLCSYFIILLNLWQANQKIQGELLAVRSQRTSRHKNLGRGVVLDMSCFSAFCLFGWLSKFATDLVAASPSHGSPSI